MVYRPVLSRVRRAARRHGLDPRAIKRSTRKHKKLVYHNSLSGRSIHFGDNRYSDFTIHRSQSRRRNFHRRHAKAAMRRMSPAHLAAVLLW